MSRVHEAKLGGSARLRAAGLNVHTLCEFNETE